MAKTFDGPPTLERSGSEHRLGRFPPSLLRKERLGERGGAFLKGKEGRVGFRKNSFLAKGRQRVSKVHTLQSPHNIYQRYEKGNRHTPSSIHNIPHDYWRNAPPTIVMMSREKVSVAFVPASLNARMELATNLFMIKELFLIDFNSSTHYTYCRYLNNKYKHEKEKTLDCYN